MKLVFGLSIGFQNGTISRPGTWWRGPWSWLTCPTIRHFCWANHENFSLFHAGDQKLFHFYFRPHRQMHFLHPYMHGRDFFYMEIYTFHYTTFLHLLCSLTHFICEGLKIFQKFVWELILDERVEKISKILKPIKSILIPFWFNFYLTKKSGSKLLQNLRNYLLFKRREAHPEKYLKRS